ncbi:MAG: PAS domain S-box protein, partial [Bacteroidota bacterium]
SILVNDAFEELVGKNNEQKEVRFNELVTEEDREKLFESRERLIRGSEWVDYTVRIHPPNGPLKHVAVRDSFFNYKNHLVTLSVMNDITDRVLVEKKNKEIEERTRQIIDSALDAIVLTDLLGNIVDWNRQAQSIFGWVGREVAGKKLEDIILPDSITQISEPEKPQQKLTLNKLIETTGIGAGERTFPIELFISQIITLEGKLLAFYIRDISVRKDTEKKIQESERIEAILNNYSSSVHQIDNIPAILDHLVATFNSICNLCEITVYLVDLTGDSLIPFHIGSTILPGGTDDYFDHTIQIGQGLIGKSAKGAEIIVVQDRSKDDEYGLKKEIPGAELAAPIMVNNKVFAVMHYKTHVIGFFSEFNQNIIRKLFDSTSGRIAKIIDEQNQMKMTRELIRNNAQLQQYSYIVSHNLRAPIANLLGLSKIFNQSNPSDERNKLIIKNIESSANNIDVILRDLNEILSIKKDASKSKEYIRFDDLMFTVVKGLEREIAEVKPLIKTDFKAEGIRTIKPYMTSIFSNLIGNAIKYRSDKRPCEICISTHLSGESTVIVFEDNGIGIDMEKFGDKIFGLYKRFHMHVEGTGIGLHLV